MSSLTCITNHTIAIFNVVNFIGLWCGLQTAYAYNNEVSLLSLDRRYTWGVVRRVYFLRCWLCLLQALSFLRHARSTWGMVWHNLKLCRDVCMCVRSFLFILALLIQFLSISAFFQLWFSLLRELYGERLRLLLSLSVPCSVASCFLTT